MSSILLAIGILSACSNTEQNNKSSTSLPTTTIQSPRAGDEIGQGIPVELEGVAQDSKFADSLDTLTPQWTANEQPICEDSVAIDTAGNITCTHTFDTDGDIELGLVVTNPDGVVSEDAVTITVFTNQPPEAEILQPLADGVYYTDVPVDFSASASDNEDATSDLVVNWSSSLDGDLGFATSLGADGSISASTLLTQGEHVISFTVTDSGNLSTAQTVTINVGGDNTIPSCDILAPLAGQAYQVGASVELSGQAQDPDGVPYSSFAAVWSSDIDGELHSQSPDENGNIVYTTSELTQGEHVITLVVTDEVGGECTATSSLVIDAAPVVQIDSPATGFVSNESLQVDFSGTVSDDEDSADALQVSWESNVDGPLTIQNPDSAGITTATSSELSIGSHTITLTATDSNGFSATDSIEIRINDLPSPPELQILPTSPNSSNNLQASIVTDSADQEGDSITYSYAWLRNGVPTGQTTYQVPYGATTRGDEWTVIVTPNDGLGDGESAQASTTIGNTAPVVNAVSISPASPTEVDTLSCDVGSAYDADSDTITYTYNWVVNGAPTGVTNQTLANDWFARGDTVFCTVLPNDGYDDGLAVISSSVTVQNTPPELTDVTIDPSPAYEASTITCTPGSASDVDGDQVSFNYSWLVNGVLINSSSTSIDGSSFSEGDTVVCRVTPEDVVGDLGTPVDSNAVVISNTAPVLASATLGPEPAYEASTLTCTPGTTSDDDGDGITFAYDWSVNGTRLGVQDATLDGSAFNKNDSITCYVIPNDGDEDGAEVTANTVVISNTAPVISAVAIDPDPANEDSILTCGVTAADDDGDALTYTYSWSVDGVAIAATSSTINGADFERGNSITCTVIPNDGTEDGVAVTSDPVVIDNTLPVLADVTLTPDPAYEASTLTCTPGASSDSDGDSVSFTYIWSVNATTVAETSPNLQGSDFNKGDSVVCIVLPNDGISDGAPVTSNAVVISNTAPVLASASLGPEPAYEASTLTCTPGTASDDDGDGVTFSYDWSVNGYIANTEAATLDGSAFNKNDSVTCYVIPNDGDEDGIEVTSNTVVISNTAPVISAVVIDPNPANEDSTLTCGVTAADDDGDALTYTYSWSVDGVAIASTSSTINGVYFDRGNSVVCSAIPNDGTEDGASVSSSPVVIENTPPVLADVALTPDPAYEASTLTCTPGASSDSDGDGVSYTYAWSVNATIIAETSPNLQGNDFNKGDSVVCIVIPNDGTEDGASVISNAVVISNTAPVLASASLSPDPAYEDTTLTCSPGSSSDDDGDGVSLAYDWSVNGTMLGVQATTLDGSSFNKNEAVACHITPNDGTVNGAEVISASIVISNTAPTVSSVSISPASAYTTDTIEATPSGWYDLDGDAEGYMYDWFVNNVSVSQSSSLGPSEIVKGDVVRLELTPYDGQGTGTAVVSADLTILNSLPEAPVVEIQPTDAQPEDDITCAVVTPSYDADGDTVTYNIKWANNGLPEPSLENVNPISYTYTANGDTWTCTVMPNDGDANGSAAYSSQVVQDTTAPTTPVLDAIDPYRNSDAVTITGTTEAGATVTLYQDCTSGQSQYTATASSTGAFSFSVTIASGDACDFYTYATDMYGNQSASSALLSTEYCSTGDTYDDMLGYGDTCADSINEWSTLADDASQTISVTGNIINSADQDWYVFSTSQTVTTSGYNNYNFEVELTSGASQYNIKVYRGSCAATDLVYCLSEGSTQDSGYDTFDYYAYDDGDGSGHQTPPATNYCSNGSLYDNCDNLADTYYVEVIRTGNSYDCTPYTLVVTNGN